VQRRPRHHAQRPQVRYFSPAGPPVVTAPTATAPGKIVVHRRAGPHLVRPAAPGADPGVAFDLRFRDFLAFACASMITAAGIVLEVAAFTLQ